jgi:hypothetical protein
MPSAVAAERLRLIHFEAAYAARATPAFSSDAYRVCCRPVRPTLTVATIPGPNVIDSQPPRAQTSCIVP